MKRNGKSGRPLRWSAAVSILLTMSAGYNVTEHWTARVSWNRVMTTYDKDSDIYLAGVGYRF
jgi:hypothetical protein